MKQRATTRNFKQIISLGIVALLFAQAVSAQPIPAHIAAAVADTNRPQDDRQRDIGRKPAEVIAFAGLKVGDTIADFMPGRGYFTRLFCKAVGEAGRVYAISVPRKASGNTSRSAAPLVTSCNNVTTIELRPSKRPAPELYSSSDDPGAVYEYWAHIPAAENFAASEPLDLIWTSENYHDLYNEGLGKPNMALVNRALFNALKPGGVLIIEDHVAAAGSGARDTATLHRIDPTLVKQEITAAGFEFIGESTVLRNRDDTHQSKAHELHDATDRFLFKFRRP